MTEPRVTEYNLENHEIDFMAAFESCSLAPEYFDHAGHLKITWLYLKALPLNQAVDKVMSGIKKYAEHLGAKDKYHATLTWFMAYLVNHRKVSQTINSWQEFRMQNQDLFVDARALIDACYSKALLASETARRRQVMPDIKQPDWLPKPSGESGSV